MNEEVLDKEFLISIPTDVFEMVWLRLEKYDIEGINDMIDIFPELAGKIELSVRRVDTNDVNIIDVLIYRFKYLKEIRLYDVTFDDIESVETLLNKYDKITSMSNINLLVFNDDTVFSILRLIRKRIETGNRDFELDFHNVSYNDNDEQMFGLYKRIMYDYDAFLFDVPQFQLDYIILYIRIIQPKTLVTYSDSNAEEFVGCKSITKVHVIGRSDYEDEHIIPLDIRNMLSNNHEYLVEKRLIPTTLLDNDINARTSITEITFEAEPSYKFDYGILNPYNGTEEVSKLYRFINVVKFDVPIRISQVPYFVDFLPSVKKYSIIYRKEEDLSKLNLYPDIKFNVHEFNPDPEGNNYGIEISDTSSDSDSDLEIYDTVVNESDV